MEYVFGLLLSILRLVITPEMNEFLRRMQPRHLLSVIVFFVGIYCSVKMVLPSLPREVAVDSDQVSFLYPEEIPDDVLGFVSVEVLAGEDVHGETLSDGPAMDGHVRRGDDAHTCDSTFVLEGV